MVPQAASNVAEIATAFRGGTVRGGAIELSSSADWLRVHGATVRPVLLPNDDRDRFRAAAGHFSLDPAPRKIDFIGLLRSLPIAGMIERMEGPPTDWDAFVTPLPRSPEGARAGFVQPEDTFDTPALLIDSWYDYGPANTLRLVNQLAARGRSETAKRNVFAVIGPTTHCAYEAAAESTVVGRRPVGDARFDFFGLYLAWFDHWLKGADNGVTASPKLQLYVMGRGEWRGEAEWPLARTIWTRYYLGGQAPANGRFGGGTLGTALPRSARTDSFGYDPATPVPSTGGPDFGANNPDLPPGALDQSTVEMRHDVLVYSTPPLERGVEVTGPIRLELFVSSDAPDTDFTGKLVDVDPAGRAFNVQEGILRVRYREGWDRRAAPLERNRVYRIELDLEATSNYFRPGHRIRLEVSSSNFPRFDRNLNTGGDNVRESSWRTARNVIHQGPGHPSALVLPVIPER
jgi:putative CocE/NonD family hydrolase